MYGSWCRYRQTTSQYTTPCPTIGSSPAQPLGHQQRGGRQLEAPFTFSYQNINKRAGIRRRMGTVAGTGPGTYEQVKHPRLSLFRTVASHQSWDVVDCSPSSPPLPLKSTGTTKPSTTKPSTTRTPPGRRRPLTLSTACPVVLPGKSWRTAPSSSRCLPGCGL